MHNTVRDAFQRLGWIALETWRAPHCPDLIVARGQRVILVEVKSKGGKLTQEQQDRFDVWPGETAVVSSVDDVLGLV